jgi:tRNA-2-methylthio-N6-dimethylallyladenosine synthase
MNPQNPTKSLYIKTFGCQMNVRDSERIRDIYNEFGYSLTDSLNSADAIVFNSCSVRQKAEEKLYSELGRLKPLKKLNPRLRIVVAGCIAEQEGQNLLDRFPYIDFVFGPQQIDKLLLWLQGDYGNSTALGENPQPVHLPSGAPQAGRMQAFVTIMYGCNNFCSYCVVPYTRGREKSRPSREIIEEISQLAQNSVKEVTLLGQNVNSYGKGLDETIDFADLLKRLNAIDGIERIRFVTSHPRDFNDKLIQTMSECSKVCKHIHLPLQSGSDRALSLMNRGYTFREYAEKIQRLRALIPDIAITSDFIVGFPGETEEDFQKTIEAIKTIRYDGVYAFKYSRRPYTKALEMEDNVSDDDKGRRLQTLLEIQDKITSEINESLNGQTLEVLVEGVNEKDASLFTGRTSTNKIVHFHPQGQALEGRLVQALITRAKRHCLIGELA